MVLPFVTIGSKLLSCSLADRHRAHRSFFIVSLFAALIGYGSFAVLPYFIHPQPEENGLNKLAFALICLMTSIGTISMSVISCLSDAFAVNSAKKYSTSYGMIRLWGTIGWGVGALLLAYINQIDMPQLVPGLIMLIILIAIDIFFTVTWPNRDDFKLNKSASDVSVEDVVTVLSSSSVPVNSFDNGGNSYGTSEPTKNNIQIQPVDNSQSTRQREPSHIDISSVSMQWILFKQVAFNRRSIFRYMTLFTISGALISLQWSYFFLYLEKIYQADFSYISGLSMFGQSILGELPFFLLSQYFIKLLGRSHTVSISIMSIGLRYQLYQHLLPNASMYFVLLTEPLQGPNFGLFYVVMTEVGLDYSDCENAIVEIVEKGLVANDPKQIDKLRQALRATMQSIMSACYEGLGVGIGSVIGGLTIDYYGYDNLWFYSSMIAFFLGAANLLIDWAKIPILVDRKPKRALKSSILPTT